MFCNLVLRHRELPSEHKEQNKDWHICRQKSLCPCAPPDGSCGTISQHCAYHILQCRLPYVFHSRQVPEPTPAVCGCQDGMAGCHRQIYYRQCESIPNNGSRENYILPKIIFLSFSDSRYHLIKTAEVWQEAGPLLLTFSESFLSANTYH